MAKVVDITAKLSFDENPRISIRGDEFEVNADAKTVLEIMGDFSQKTQMEASMSAYERMFSEGDRRKINDMKLPFKDLMIVIETAMELVQGTDDQGEQ